MQTHLSYPARLEADEDGRILVTFRDLPEALTDGAHRAEALAEAADCLEVAVATRIGLNEDIPATSSARRGEVLIPVPLPTAAKVALVLAMRASGVNKSELARRLGCDVREVRRLTDPRHRSHSDRLAEAIKAAGGRVAVTVTTNAAE